jgi:hypothetical protein
MSEFGVYSFAIGNADDVATIDGRVHTGTLKVGAIFRVVRHPNQQDRSIHLQVTRIQYYDVDMPEIDEGLTARLDVNGRGSEFLSHNCVVSEDALGELLATPQADQSLVRE